MKVIYEIGCNDGLHIKYPIISSYSACSFWAKIMVLVFILDDFEMLHMVGSCPLITTQWLVSMSGFYCPNYFKSQKMRESAAQASAWLMPSVKVSEMKGAVSKFWTQSGPSPYTHRPTMHPLLYPPIPYPVPNPSSSECFLPFQGAGSLNGSASNWVPAIACSGDLFMKQPAFTLHAPAWSSEYNRLCIVFTFLQNQHGYVGSTQAVSLTAFSQFFFYPFPKTNQ